MKHIFLAGYEKDTIRSFIQKLTSSNITTVIDIREKPISRKYGFSKTKLRDYLEENNIKYYHLKELGSPTQIRNKLRETHDYLSFFKNYRSYIRSNKQFVDKLVNIIYANGHSALMCYEEDCELCHRSIVASELLKRERQIKITPL